MIDLPAYYGGRRVDSAARIEVRDPYSGEVVGTVAAIDRTQTEEAIAAAAAVSCELTRHERAALLERARLALAERRDEFARLVTSESGLCLRDTLYEVGRAGDVLRFAALEALRDDGQIFACDVSASPRARRIYTTREPLRLVAAITPFNHPLNQVLHKVAPAIAAGAPLILKPSEKTPLTAVRAAELLYDAGLPRELLSVVHGAVADVAETLVRSSAVDLVTFTGSVPIGKHIAAVAGYKRLCLELGGNSPLLVLADADLDLAARLAAEGAFRNSGQRCTAVKRLLVDQRVLDDFTERLVETAREYRSGDPRDPETRVGTVIDEDAARRLEQRVATAAAAGARVLLGGTRRGALFAPTVLADVPRDTELVVEESFGPLAPVIAVDGVDDAIGVANATAFGLSAGVVTRDLDSAIRVIRRLRTGTVNVNEVPGYRLESSPFGGVKDSGLGIKEGVIEAMKFMTTVKTYSLPW